MVGFAAAIHPAIFVELDWYFVNLRVDTKGTDRIR
ncbi:Uncharacterised protein [uncultured archaeon]|nr:Uncharacterised protein [uncultured archaeon]